MGADLRHRHYSIHHPSADVGMAALCGNGAWGGAGSVAGNVFPDDGVVLRSGSFPVRGAGFFIARRGRLSLCRNHAEHRIAGSTSESSLDCRVAQVSRGFAGNRSRAGRGRGLANAQEKLVVRRALLVVCY